MNTKQKQPTTEPNIWSADNRKQEAPQTQHNKLSALDISTERVWLCRCGIADGMPYNALAMKLSVAKKLFAQRDELLAALKRARNSLSDIYSVAERKDKERFGAYLIEILALANQGLAAIAAATGENK